MPQTEVFFYQDDDGRAPVVEWLKTLRREDRKAYAKCVARIRRLAEAGPELRRPEADHLRDGLFRNQLPQFRVVAGERIDNVEGVFRFSHRLPLPRRYAVRGHVQRRLFAS